MLRDVPGVDRAIAVPGRVRQQEIGSAARAHQEGPVEILIRIDACPDGPAVQVPLIAARPVPVGQRPAGREITPGVVVSRGDVAGDPPVRPQPVSAVADDAGRTGSVPASRRVCPQVFAEPFTGVVCRWGRAVHAQHRLVWKGNPGFLAERLHKRLVTGGAGNLILVRGVEGVLIAVVRGWAVTHRLAFTIHAQDYAHDGHLRIAVVARARLVDEVQQPGLEPGVVVIDADVVVLAGAPVNPIHVERLRYAVRAGNQPGGQERAPVGIAAAPVAVLVGEPEGRDHQSERLRDDLPAGQRHSVGRGGSHRGVKNGPVDIVGRAGDDVAAGGAGVWPQVLQIVDVLDAQGIARARRVEGVVGGAQRRHSVGRSGHAHEIEAAEVWGAAGWHVQGLRDQPATGRRRLLAAGAGAKQATQEGGQHHHPGQRGDAVPGALVHQFAPTA